MRLLLLLALLFPVACANHERQVRVVSDDGRVEVIVERDGTVRHGGRVVGRVDVMNRLLTLTEGSDAGKPIDVYDGTRKNGSVIWRGPDYTLRNLGLTWSVVEDRLVRVNGKPWGRCVGHDNTTPQRIRFVAAVSTISRLVRLD